MLVGNHWSARVAPRGGRFVAALLFCSIAYGADVNAYPMHAQYWTGRVMQSQGRYSRHNDDVFYGKDMPDSKWQGYMKFDLTTLPDSLVVDDVDLCYQCITASNPPPFTYVRLVTCDPLTAPPESLWRAITTGTIVAPSMQHGAGFIQRRLNEDGEAALEAAMSQGWLALGIHKYDTSNTKGHIKGYPASKFRPYLRLRGRVRDVAVVAILSPVGVVQSQTLVSPKVIVRNSGEVDAPFQAWVMLSRLDRVEYREGIDVASLPVGGEITLAMPDHAVGDLLGEWTVRCSLYMRGDIKPDNNQAARWFQVATGASRPARYGWEEVERVPLMPAATPIRYGGWLASNPGTGMVYCARGGRKPDFFCYSPFTRAWTGLAPIPAGARGKLFGKGARGVSDGGRYVYATKGNNTQEFWRYDVIANQWQELPNVPLAGSRRRLKDGVDLSYVEQYGTGYVYLLKGPKTDFCRYSVALGQWETLAPSPRGFKGKWRDGSWLVYDGDGRLYAHKSMNHELWYYDLEADEWSQTRHEGMPLVGGSMRPAKAKDGSSAAWYDGALYSLKGGNTQEFWKYEPGRLAWTELDTMPSFGSTIGLARVRGGGDFVAFPMGRLFYATKGNSTLEFWRYTLPPDTMNAPIRRDGVLGQARASEARLVTFPNPVAAGSVRLGFSRHVRGPVSVQVFDAAGRVVHRAVVTPAGAGPTAVLDLGSLSNGVYLMKLEFEGTVARHKLVLER